MTKKEVYKDVETLRATSHNDEKKKKEASLRGTASEAWRDEANQKDSERWIASTLTASQ
jgi:hypothetical protein